MRVCFVSFEYPPNIFGGAGVYAEAIVEGLKRKGVEPFVITRGNQSDINQGICRVPVTDVTYWRRLFFMKAAMARLDKLNKSMDFDLVHLNEPHILLRKPDLPTVCTVHSTQINELKLKLADSGNLKTLKNIEDLLLKSPVGYMFDIRKTHLVDKIICPSPHLSKLINSYCFVDKEKISMIPNGLDLTAFDQINDYDRDILSKFDLEKDNFLLFIGRLSILKGVQYLIEAFKEISKRHPNLKLAIVGTGESENYLKTIAHGIKNIVFVGYTDSLAVKKTLYENSVAVVVPSQYEALPMVIIEAMACRKVVISSNVGGIPLLVKHGKNGFLTKPGDSKSIERFCELLCEDETLRKQMGLTGRKMAEKEFSIDKMVNRTVDVYKTLC